MHGTIAESWRRLAWAVPQSLAMLGCGLASLLAVPLVIYSVPLCLVGIGFWLLPRELRLVGRLARGERARIARWSGHPTVSFTPTERRLTALLVHATTRRDLRWLPVTMIAGTALGILGAAVALLPLVALAAIGLWWVFPDDEPIRVVANLPLDSWTAALTIGVLQLVLAVVLALLLAPLLAQWGLQLSRLLLEPSKKQRLAEQVDILARSRSGAVAAYDTDLRRIERDLHDGTQAQLVSLALRLGIAERTMVRDPQAAADLVTQARLGAEEAMTDLRSLMRTMYPPILADKGLEGALSSVVARSTIPAELVMSPLGTVPAPVESTVYYVVNEALTNVAKHAAASRVTVTVERHDDILAADVTDDGVGGARVTEGSGLLGMKSRVEAVDGFFTVSSPAEGPTVIRAECPCVS